MFKHIIISINKNKIKEFIRQLTIFNKVNKEDNFLLNINFINKLFIYKYSDSKYFFEIFTKFDIIFQNIKLDSIVFRINNKLINFLKLIKIENFIKFKLLFDDNNIKQMIILYNNNLSSTTFNVILNNTDTIKSNFEFNRKIILDKKILNLMILKFKRIIHKNLLLIFRQNKLITYKYNEMEIQILEFYYKFMDFKKDLFLLFNEFDLLLIENYIKNINKETFIELYLDDNNNIKIINNYLINISFIISNSNNNNFLDLSSIINNYKMNYVINLSRDSFLPIIKRSLNTSINRNISKYAINLSLNNNFLEVQSLGDYNKNIEKIKIDIKTINQKQKSNLNTNILLTINCNSLYHFISSLDGDNFLMFFSSDKELPIIFEYSGEIDIIDSVSDKKELRIKYKFQKIIMLFTENVYID